MSNLAIVKHYFRRVPAGTKQSVIMPDFKLHYIILLDVSFSLIGKHWLPLRHHVDGRWLPIYVVRYSASSLLREIPQRESSYIINATVSYKRTIRLTKVVQVGYGYFLVSGRGNCAC